MPLKLCALGTCSVNGVLEFACLVNGVLEFALEIESSLHAVIYGLNKKRVSVEY